MYLNIKEHNMRELKFRVWDVKLNEYVPKRELDRNFGLDFNGELRCLIASREKDPFILQQYTGLTDSKENHIFEGDIVNYKTWEGRHDGIIEENQTQVKFKDGAYYPRYINDECEDSWYSFKVYDLEVVGNVFETPHLDKNE
jgi:uncharacterized phage protein (TIGR01671 family)